IRRRQGFHGAPAAFRLRGKPGRRGKPGQPPGGDDACVRASRAPPGPGRHRQPGAVERGRGGRRGPAGRRQAGAAAVIAGKVRDAGGVTLAGPFDAWLQYRSLTWEMAKRDVLGRYREASFGLLWSLISPFLMLLIYT